MRSKLCWGALINAKIPGFYVCTHLLATPRVYFMAILRMRLNSCYGKWCWQAHAPHLKSLSTVGRAEERGHRLSKSQNSVLVPWEWLCYKPHWPQVEPSKFTSIFSRKFHDRSFKFSKLNCKTSLKSQPLFLSVSSYRKSVRKLGTKSSVLAPRPLF